MVIQPQPRSPGTYWKLNISILRDPGFLASFRRSYTELREQWKELHSEQEQWEQEPPDPDLGAAQWWEHTKPAIGKFC